MYCTVHRKQGKNKKEKKGRKAEGKGKGSTTCSAVRLREREGSGKCRVRGSVNPRRDDSGSEARAHEAARNVTDPHPSLPRQTTKRSSSPRRRRSSSVRRRIPRSRLWGHRVPMVRERIPRLRRRVMAMPIGRHAAPVPIAPLRRIQRRPVLPAAAGAQERIRARHRRRRAHRHAEVRPPARTADVRRRVQRAAGAVRQAAAAPAAVRVRVHAVGVVPVVLVLLLEAPDGRVARAHAARHADHVPRRGHGRELGEGLQGERVVQREAVRRHRRAPSRVEHRRPRCGVRQVRLGARGGTVRRCEDAATCLHKATSRQY